MRKLVQSKYFLNFILGFLYIYINFIIIIIKFILENPNLDPTKYCPDGRYCHLQQVQERLNFLKFCLKVYYFKYNLLVSKRF